MKTRNRKIGYTHAEVIEALCRNGWNLRQDDLMWRSLDGKQLVSVEALRDICEIFPSLTERMLRLLLAGHNIEINTTEVDDVTTTITLRPVGSCVKVKRSTYPMPIM